MPASSLTPVAAEAPRVTARVINEMNTVAVASAAKRPSSTERRGCGVDSTSSRRPSSSSADHRLACVTANAIKSTGKKMNRALRMAALVAVSLPPSLSTFSSSAEPCMSDLNLPSVCCTTITIQPAKPAMASVHQKVGTAAMARPRA